MTNERYHYLECGLDDVYLMNGFERFESKRGLSVAIRDIDMLHQAIGQYLCDEKKELSGKEIRFLRREMLLSQATLASMLDVKEQTIYRWESGKTSMPGAAESLIRALYKEHINSRNDSLRSQLKRIADLEDEIDHRQEMIFKLNTGNQKRQSTGQRPAQWALAA